ncbi:uncharacterized protein LOC135503591 [Lineus longissimus]|uniref:uncharacterized protein LOC135503591 n=1 Tax=Lineus longissimus TaxID=88925 RepID=UPI00315DC785
METTPLGNSALALARCRVLYIGTALPTETSEGSEAVQKPLRERYNKDGKLEGIDSRLIVYTDGIQLQFIEDAKTVIWFPILSLHVCAAVKCVKIINAATGGQGHNFVPLDTISPELKDVSPPIFSMITRRVRGIKILECHSFICKSDAAAMALVQCCTHAYETKDIDGKPLDEDGLNTTSMTEQGEHGYKSWVNASQYKEVPTVPGGYYVGDGEILVKNYGIWTNSTKIASMKRAQTLGPSHMARGAPMGALRSPVPQLDEKLARGNARIAYVPASMIRNVNRQTGAGTIDASTLNKYLRRQSPVRAPEDDTKSFYMYPQDKPRISYWQSSMPMTRFPKSPVPSPDYDHPNNQFTYPPQRLPSTPEYYTTSPDPSYPPNRRDKSPPQRLQENGVRPQSGLGVPTGQREGPRHSDGRPLTPPPARVQREGPRHSDGRPLTPPPRPTQPRHSDGRPHTPPPDYDIEEHFEGYWHGYSERFQKSNLNDLMKKRASQALDERVHEEFVLKNGAPKEPDFKPRGTKSASKIFSNERAFSRSIQMEMDARPGANKMSAYDLLGNDKDGKPYEDLDSTLGYLP